jgi:hypothetical protein
VGGIEEGEGCTGLGIAGETKLAFFERRPGLLAHAGGAADASGEEARQGREGKERKGEGGEGGSRQREEGEKMGRPLVLLFVLSCWKGEKKGKERLWDRNLQDGKRTCLNRAIGSARRDHSRSSLASLRT